VQLDDIVGLGEIRTVGDLRRALALIPDDTEVLLGSMHQEYDTEGNWSGAEGPSVPVFEAAWRVIDESDIECGCPPALQLDGVFDGSDLRAESEPEADGRHLRVVDGDAS
jgi:hypothetical protein